MWLDTDMSDAVIERKDYTTGEWKPVAIVRNVTGHNDPRIEAERQRQHTNHRPVRATVWQYQHDWQQPQL
jgi:hypothetical protein